MRLRAPLHSQADAQELQHVLGRHSQATRRAQPRLVLVSVSVESEVGPSCLLYHELHSRYAQLGNH